MDGPGVPVEEYRALMQLFDGKCAYCRDGVATTMDHVTPLSRGGKHEAANLLPACARCNFQKHHKTLSEWAKEK
jgi:5-methylcytosine-specific restriction endonuclease McrA